MSTRRRRTAGPAPTLVALGVALGGVALLLPALRWQVAGEDGTLSTTPGWAAVPVVAWLLVLIVRALVQAGAPTADTVAVARIESLARLHRPIVVLATAGTALTAGAATARLVHVAVDDTTVARVSTSLAAWAAPVALAVAAMAGGWLMIRRVKVNTKHLITFKVSSKKYATA